MKDTYWLEVLIHNGDDIRVVYMAHDGLIYKAEFDVVKDLLKKYPMRNGDWYFNESYDRMIAEDACGVIVIHPSLFRDFKLLI